MRANQIVYVVDSDSTLSSALTELLGTYGIQVRPFREPSDFLDCLADQSSPDGCLLLTDALAGGKELANIRLLRERDHRFPVLLLADVVTPELREKAMELGVADVIPRDHVANYVFDRLAQLLPSDSGAESVARLPLGDGTEVRFRTMQPEDVDIEQAFVRRLSARSRYLRFFSGLSELPPALLHQFTHPEYPDSYAVIATVADGTGEKQIGVARYSPTRKAGTVEFAVVIADEWQGHGIARHLLTTVIAAAVMAGLKRIEGLVLRENKRMLGLARELGFEPIPGDEDVSIVRVAKDLTAG